MATEPINYSIDAGNPFQSVLQGFKVGDFLQQRQMQQQQQIAEQQKAQQQAAAQAQMNADLGAVANNPNASGSDYAGLITKYPQLSEQLKRGWDVLNPAQQQARLSSATQVYSALQNNKPDIAMDMLKEQATAARNSGNEQDAKAAETMAQWIERDPGTAKTSIALRLAATVGADKFADVFGKLGAEQRAAEQAPSDLAEKRAKAQQEMVKAKYADSVALQDIEKRGWDIKKVVSDIGIDKENARIRAMEAGLKREENDLKRQELQMKITDAKTAREDKIREKVSGAESAASTIDNMLNTADRVLKNPSLNSVIGSIQGRLPSITSDEGADAIALIDTLGSQSFLSQLPSMKGLGALSEKEGDKLQSALTNLSRTQSEEQFKYNLKEAQRLMLKARQNLSEKTGVPLGAPDRPNAPKTSQGFAPTAPGAAQTAPATPQKNVVVDF
jgi:hypothetical protein